MDVHSTTEPASLVRQPQATTSGREIGHELASAERRGERSAWS
jgi:hypothetical protein